MKWMNEWSGDFFVKRAGEVREHESALTSQTMCLLMEVVFIWQSRVKGK